jgi:hypothetical protein
VVQKANALVETITEELSIQEMAPAIASMPSAAAASAVADPRTGRAVLVKW